MNTQTATTEPKAKRTSAKEIERQEAIERLRQWVKPGDTLFTILRHCSASGMSRVIDVIKITDENHPVDNGPRVLSLGFNIAIAIDHKYDRDKEGIKIGGCGSDMGFEIVYHLGRILWPEGFECIGQNCRSNDHFNGDRNREPHQHKDGGYAINQRWL